MAEIIEIKSSYLGTKIPVSTIDKGFAPSVSKYILYDQKRGHLYLLSSKNLLVRATISVSALLFIVEFMEKHYGERLGYLGWVDWLSEIKQIHNADPECFIFADALAAIEHHPGTITKDIFLEYMEEFRRKND